jgi:hypothetical protein
MLGFICSRRAEPEWGITADHPLARQPLDYAQDLKPLLRIMLDIQKTQQFARCTPTGESLDRSGCHRPNMGRSDRPRTG